MMLNIYRKGSTLPLTIDGKSTRPLLSPANDNLNQNLNDLFKFNKTKKFDQLIFRKGEAIVFWFIGLFV